MGSSVVPGATTFTGAPGIGVVTGTSLRERVDVFKGGTPATVARSVE